ncbi:NAD-dependent epimerase/dehydratase family protein [Azospirillum rugosum]|uniref:NAD-dependent epimerase/dehydratase family protein n=1 Tax=Azospirillum rugosum TaxID=416170 RepID=UPI00361502A7
MVRVLVTGAGGVCGSRVVAKLLELGHDVTAVAGRSGLGRLPAGGERLTTLVGDLCADDLPLPTEAQAVVHAAAQLPDPGVDVSGLVRSNVLATQRLVERAVSMGAHTFIYFSSLSVYGRITGPQVDETTPILDPEPYGLTKLLGERLVADRADRLRSMALRLPGVIGPGSRRNWLSRVMETARRGDEITLFQPEAPFNNAAHVDDVARFVGTLLDGDWTGADAVTLAAAGMTSIEGAARAVVEGLGSRSPIAVRAHAGSSFTVSSARATQRYGYAPMPIEAMLARFARENAAGSTQGAGRCG